MADEPRKKKFDWQHPGGKEIAIVVAGVLGLVVVWSVLRKRTAAPAAPATSGTVGGGTARATATAATSPEVLRLWLVDHARSPRDRDREPRDDDDRRHRNPHRGESYARQVANGTRSLAQVAEERHTTVHHIIQVTLNSPELSRRNRERFQDYVRAGTNRRMPAGLVFYTSHQGSDPGSRNVGGGREHAASS